MKKLLFSAALVLALSVSFTSCREVKEGADKAGDAMENAAEETEDAVKGGFEATGEAMDNVVEETEEAVESVKDAIDEATDDDN
jgi:peptidoglycan hydrolase CwlO-like protein